MFCHIINSIQKIKIEPGNIVILCTNIPNLFKYIGYFDFLGSDTSEPNHLRRPNSKSIHKFIISKLDL